VAGVIDARGPCAARPRCSRASAPQDFGHLERDLADATEPYPRPTTKAAGAPAALSAQADQSQASAPESRGGRCRRPSFRSSSGAIAATSRAPAIIDSTTDLVAATECSMPAPIGSTSSDAGGGGRAFVIDDGERQRTGFARHFRCGDEIGATAGLRHHDEQRTAHVGQPLIGGHDRRRGGGCQQAKAGFEQVAQINADMTRAAAPAEHDDARLGLPIRSAIAANRSVRASRRSAAAGISAVSHAIALSGCGSAIASLGRADGGAQIAAVALQELRGFAQASSKAEQNSRFHVAVGPVRDNAPRRPSGQRTISLTMAAARRSSLAFRARMSTINPR
jgi:hypothetical protein